MVSSACSLKGNHVAGFCLQDKAGKKSAASPTKELWVHHEENYEVMPSSAGFQSHGTPWQAKARPEESSPSYFGETTPPSRFHSTQLVHTEAYQ